MITYWFQVVALVLAFVIIAVCVVALIAEALDLPRAERRSCRPSPHQVRAHQARRELDVANERLRLRVEVNRHLRELDVEIEQERRRRAAGPS